jgi:DNA-binding Xre family transcriptional regulator
MDDRFKARVKEKILSKNKSLEAFCRRHGMARQHLQGWLKSDMRTSTVQRLAEMLGCQPGDLINE